MKKQYKFFSIIVATILFFTPCFVSAEPENTTPEPTPSASPTPEPTPSPSPTPSEEITLKLDKKEAKLDAGKTITLTATLSSTDSTIEWKSSNEEIATVNQEGVVTAKEGVAGDVVITATVKGTTVSDTCTITVLRNIGKDATLKNLSVKNGDLDQPFKSDVFKYKVTVSATTNSLVFMNIETTDSRAKSLTTNNNKISNGDIVKIVVTAEDGTTSKTYEFEIIKGAPSIALKSLKINGYALNESFSADTLKYTATIPYEIDTLTIEAPPEGDKAKVKITGNTNLKLGANTIKVTVTDEDGNSRTYEIIVTRDEKVTIDEKPSSIISSGTDDNSVTTPNNNKSNSTKNKSDDSFLKYAIVSIACFILFAIGGIGIYFYVKTSPKRLKKELGDTKPKMEETPITVVDDEKLGNIDSIINEDLFATKEFKKEELSDEDKSLENLFDDDSEDVK